MLKIGGFLAVVLTLWLVSCKKASSHLDEPALRKYILDESNGLRKTKTVGDVNVEVVFQPTDLMIKRELGHEKASDSALQVLRRKYEPNFYFILSLSKGGRELLHQVDPFEYGNLVRIMSFEMAEHVFLTNKSDTLHLRDFMLDRTFGLAQSTNLLFAFENREFDQSGDLEFTLNEFGLGIGRQSLIFSSEDINSAPQLIWQ